MDDIIKFLKLIIEEYLKTHITMYLDFENLFGYLDDLIKTQQPFEDWKKDSKIIGVEFDLFSQVLHKSELQISPKSSEDEKNEEEQTGNSIVQS